ncbi:hypothetical protein [Vibrio sp. WXL210]|uniref:hypothetical protein n=1 Tax=Vibrio sp. WXL210 TaxID=3450709 RepID=UPI003EC6EBFA
MKTETIDLYVNESDRRTLKRAKRNHTPLAKQSDEKQQRVWDKEDMISDRVDQMKSKIYNFIFWRAFSHDECAGMNTLPVDSIVMYLKQLNKSLQDNDIGYGPLDYNELLAVTNSGELNDLEGRVDDLLDIADEMGEDVAYKVESVLNDILGHGLASLSPDRAIEAAVIIYDHIAEHVGHARPMSGDFRWLELNIKSNGDRAIDIMEEDSTPLTSNQRVQKKRLTEYLVKIGYNKDMAATLLQRVINVHGREAYTFGQKKIAQLADELARF